MHETENPGPVDPVAGKSGKSELGGDSTAAFEFSRPPAASERRRSARLDVLIEQLVPIKLGADNGGLLLDLSAGGAAVQSVAPLQSSVASPFAFRLPRLNSQIEGTGVFVWVNDSGLAGGLRFDHLSPHAQQLLEQWLKGSRAGSAAVPPDAAVESTADPPQSVVPETTMGPAPALPTPLAMRDPALVARLRRVAQRAQILSRAQGACIALKDEQGALICEARTGTAPDVGSPINLERGLAAECVATRGLVLCNEAQNDPRVDAATRRQLGLGSAAVLPLFAGKTLFGVLGVFSGQPYAFGEQGIGRLQDWVRSMQAGVLQEVYGNLKPLPRLAPAALQRPARPAGSTRRTLSAVVLACLVLVAGLILYQRHLAPPISPLPKPPSRFGPPASHVDVLTMVLETRPKTAGNASQLPAPELASRVKISYPRAAVAQNRQGSVVLRVTVGRAGTVDDIQVLDGDQVLSAEAVSAVRQWRYKPYKLAGRQVGTELLLTVNFGLSP